jgi:hypothetical protein
LTTRPQPRGATANYRAWTDAEDATLQGRYGRDEAADIARDLGRETTAIFHRAKRLGLTARRRWTKADDSFLRMYWGDYGVATIAKQLKRSEVAVYWRAGKLDLTRGAPPGFEYVSNAAERTGFCRETLVMILRWAKVPLKRAASRATGASWHYHVVDTVDVDDAVERWLATETLKSATRRYRVSCETVERRLRASGLTLPPKPADGTHWRIPRETIDAAMAQWAKLETVNAAAVRLGLPRGTLRHRMVRAGVPRPPGKLWLVPRETVDRVAAEASP